MPSVTRSRAGRGNVPQVLNALYYALGEGAGSPDRVFRDYSGSCRGMRENGSHCQQAPETIAAQGHLEFDRTRWDVQYGSGKFFALLGKHLVNDLVQLHLKIVAKRGE
jgi:hypothetical protein